MKWNQVLVFSFIGEIKQNLQNLNGGGKFLLFCRIEF